MNKITVIILLLLPIITSSQDLVKNYEPPKVISGSDLTFNSFGNFSSDKYSSISRFYSISISPALSKFRYSDKLNYILNMGIDGSFSHNYFLRKDDTISNNSMGTGFRIDGGMNYYIDKKLFYAGLNAGSENVFRNHNEPYSANYIAPLTGYGKVVNAVEVSRVYFFEKVLKEEGVIIENLPYNVKKKLTELFDKRNNREFIYKFKEDGEIEFFTKIEKLLKDEGVIKETLGARTVLKLYRTLVNSKYLVYPKYKGCQVQLMYYYPFGINEGNTIDEPSQIILSGIYGIPLNVKAQITFYGFFSKLLKVKNKNNYMYSPFQIRNIFPLSIENTQLDNMETWYFPRYSIGYASSSSDYYFGANLSAYYYFTDFFGMRGFANSLMYLSKNDLYTELVQMAYLDFGIISKAILSAGITSAINIAPASKITYQIYGSLRLSYIIF